VSLSAFTWVTITCSTVLTFIPTWSAISCRLQPVLSMRTRSSGLITVSPDGNYRSVVLQSAQISVAKRG
jgi:hypothetical protein